MDRLSTLRDSPRLIHTILAGGNYAVILYVKELRLGKFKYSLLEVTGDKWLDKRLDCDLASV